MARQLRYHQAVFDLLGQEPRPSAARLESLRRHEERCGRAFPAAIVEWFALEDADEIFADNTTPDFLAAFDELADPAMIAQGFMAVADENQGVVAWYARLKGADDPPIYDNHDSPDPADWRFCSATFSAFIHHMIAVGQLDMAADTLTLIADDHAPEQATIERLQPEYTAGPGSHSAQRRVDRLFNQHGRLTIISALADGAESWAGRWVIESGTAAGLLALAASIWPYGTLAATLQPKSTRPEARSEEAEVIRQLRG
jgi:hypothetical protein